MNEEIALSGGMLMTLQELQKQALQLPISDRWRLVQSLLTSIQGVVGRIVVRAIALK